MNAKMWLVVALSLGVVGNAQAMSSDYIEQALISTCKSIASDRVGQMQRTLREHRLTVPLIGEKLLCNGMHVVAFAESRGLSARPAISNSGSDGWRLSISRRTGRYKWIDTGRPQG